MKILITGGAGFIGSNFVHYWLKNHPNDKIKVIDALTFAGNKDNLSGVLKKIDFVEGNITNRGQVAEAMKGMDAVVHFAAESHVDRSIFDPNQFWKTNVDGTRILLEEAQKAGVSRFHHVSTDEVYGELTLDSKERFNEDTPYAPQPDNLYAISKAEADRVTREFYKDTGMFITISNCSNNYGPYQFPEKFIPILVTNLIDGYKAPVHGDGQHVRDWIHTHDHATAVDLILEKGKPGETYLVGSRNDVPNRYIAERVVDLYGKDESWIKFVPDRHSNDRRYAIDSTRMVKELGWKPTITRENFDDGLKETINWYKNNPEWWRPLLQRRAMIADGDQKVFAFVELDRNLGKTKFIYKDAEEDDKDDKHKSIMVESDTKKITQILNKLKSHEWYKNTNKHVQKKLLDLVKIARTSGFVEDLANRPEVMGSIKQNKIVKIEYSPDKFGIYGVAIWFEVQNPEGEKHIEGYYSWAMGVKSGAKLLVLIRYKDRITHLAMTKEEKFPMGSLVYNLAGGFPHVNESVFDLFHRKIEDDLGIDVKKGSVKLGEIIGLGRVMPDSGMTNNHPFLYALVLDLEENIFPPIKIGEIYESPLDRLVLWPIERLQELVNKIDDSYFLSALARLTLSGVSDIKLGGKQVVWQKR